MVREGIPDTGSVERVNSPGFPRFVSGGRRCLTKTFLSRLHLGGHPAFFPASFLVVEGGVGLRLMFECQKPFRCFVLCSGRALFSAVAWPADAFHGSLGRRRRRPEAARPLADNANF